MESRPRPTATEATEQLREHEQMRDRVENHGQARGFTLLLLGVALVVSVFVVVFLTAMGAAGDGQVASTVAPMLVLLPLLVFSQVVNGAAQRFGIRLRPTAGHWLGAGVVVAGFATLSAVTILTEGYPWWVNLVAGLATFLVLAVGPIARLRRAATAPRQPQWVNAALTTPVRWTTAAIGFGSALLVATSTWTWFPTVSLAVWAWFLVMMIGMRSSWGLPRAGYEWGPGHWIAFGLATSVLAVLALLIAATDLVTPAISVAAAVVVLATMIPAALLPVGTPAPTAS